MCNNVIKDENHQETRVKLRNKKLNKLESAAKNKTRKILIENNKNFETKNCHINYF